MSAASERSTSPCSIDGTGTPQRTPRPRPSSVDAQRDGEGHERRRLRIAGRPAAATTSRATGRRRRSATAQLPPPKLADPQHPQAARSRSTATATGISDRSPITHHRGAGLQDGHRVTSAVERVGDDHVRITVATDRRDPQPEDGDEHDAAARPSATASRTAWPGRRARPLDPGRAVGLERFIGSGRLPASGAPGSSHPTTSRSVTRRTPTRSRQ